MKNIWIKNKFLNTLNWKLIVCLCLFRLKNKILTILLLIIIRGSFKYLRACSKIKGESFGNLLGTVWILGPLFENNILSINK